MIPRLSVFLLNDDIFAVFEDRPLLRNLGRTDYIVNEIPKTFVMGLVFGPPHPSPSRNRVQVRSVSRAAFHPGWWSGRYCEYFVASHKTYVWLPLWAPI